MACELLWECHDKAFTPCLSLMHSYISRENLQSRKLYVRWSFHGLKDAVHQMRAGWAPMPSCCPCALTDTQMPSGVQGCFPRYSASFLTQSRPVWPVHAIMGTVVHEVIRPMGSGGRRLASRTQDDVR